MNEEKTIKNRGWVKTVAIIVLAVLLVLTFFSNTIMNANLPEVAVQYVTSGSISAQIRGQATVKATETFDVIMEDTRKVKTVYARTGQEVSAGDLLFVLAEGDSEEVEAAKQALEAAETTLASLEDNLENLRRNYRRALLQAASSADYTKANREIQKLSEEISNKTAERDAIDLSDDAMKEAEKKLNEANDVIKSETQKLDEAEQALKAAKNEQKAAKDVLDAAEEPYLEQKEKVDGLEAERNNLVNTDGGGYAAVDMARQAYEAAQKATKDAENALATAHILYDAEYNKVVEYAQGMIKNDYEAANGGAGSFDTNFPEQSQKDSYYNSKYAIYLPAAAEKIKSFDAEAYNGYTAIIDAENAVSQAKANEQSAYVAYDDAYDSYARSNSDSAAYNRLSRELTTERKKLEPLETAYKAAQKSKAAKDKAVEKAQEEIEFITNGSFADAKAAQEKAQTEYESATQAYDSNKQKYNSLNTEIESLEEQLEEAIFNLAEQKKDDDVNKQLQELDFEATRSEISKAENEVAKQREKVAEAREKLEKLTSGEKETGLEIKADVNGVVKSVNVSAGNTPQQGTVIATIEVPDRGYTAELTVTSDQAQRVSIGDYAQVSTGWWGRSDITAQLVSMRADPQNPRGGRILVFQITGTDAQSGDTLNLSIGERSRSFDTVIPKSAVRSDSNGDFVLMVTVKQTPLASRYIAQRVDITKVAEDDTVVAVTGDLAYNDCVITTTSAPITNGMQVRMADD